MAETPAAGRGAERTGDAAERRVEEVFKTNGIPTFTFVEPSRYATLNVSLRTAGRGLILEGPSGIGKSTGRDPAAGYPRGHTACRASYSVNPPD